MEQLQSQIWLTASSYMGNICEFPHILQEVLPHIWLATAPYIRGKFYSIFYQCISSIGREQRGLRRLNFFAIVETGPCPQPCASYNIDRASAFHTRGMGGAIIAVLANAGILGMWSLLLFFRGAFCYDLPVFDIQFRDRPASDSKVSIRGWGGWGGPEGWGRGEVRGNHGIGSFFPSEIGGQTNIFTHSNTNSPPLITPSVLLGVRQRVLNDL